MIRRKLNNEKCGCCCTLKEKLQYLWDHTMGAIKKVNEITPDGDGKFTIEAGTNIALTEISNGLRIDTTGGVSYYTAGDTYVDVDNNDLEISLKNPGQTDGVALHNDLEVVATAVAGIVPFDATPTAGSSKGVTSDGLKTALDGKQNTLSTTTSIPETGIEINQYGKVVQVSMYIKGYNSGLTEVSVAGLPTPSAFVLSPLMNTAGNYEGLIWIDPNVSPGKITVKLNTNNTVSGSLTYLTD